MHHLKDLQLFFFFIPHYEWGLYCNHLVRPSVRPSVHTFVTDISASTGRNDFIFDLWLWHGDLYRVSPFQVYRTSTSGRWFSLSTNKTGYHDIAEILLKVALNTIALTLTLIQDGSCC